MTQTFLFGPLDRPWRPIQLGFGEVRPLAGHSDIADGLRTWGADQGHTDGWVYPSRLTWTRGTRNENGVEVQVPWPTGEPFPNIWAVPPSHELRWDLDDQGETERCLPAIVINALGWAHGNRVQFDDWGIDDRVRWRCSPTFLLTDAHVPHFLEQVVRTSRDLAGHQVEILTLLILHNRVPAFFWDWERYHWQYVAMDACWQLLVAQGRIPAKRQKKGHKPRRWTHEERFEALNEFLGVPRVPDAEQRIVRQRNDLAHQGLWAGGIPGHAFTTDTDMDYWRLSRLVDRMLLHLFDIDCGLRTRSWDPRSLVTETMDMRVGA